VTRRASASGELLGGATRVFIAEAISLPTALITAGFLARRLGPGSFGIFTLTATIVVWLEWTLVTLFSRAAVKLVADADDWRPAGSTVLRLFTVSGVIGWALVWVAAPGLAALLHEPSLARYLRLLAFDVPVFMLTQAHVQVLTGTGDYGRRATVVAWRWLSRAVLIVALVLAGFAIEGALAGIVGASIIELLVARRFVRPRFGDHRPTDARALWTYGLPLLVAGLTMRLFDRLDLLTLKALGATAELAGIYGAAQNLTIIPGLIGLATTTLLVSTLSRALRAGDERGARALVRDALRGTALLLPLAAVAAGASSGLATLIFGSRFAATGPLLAVLMFGAIAVLAVSVASALLAAIGRASWVMAITLPVAPLALLGYVAVIPRYGASGAALVTTAVSVLGAVAALVTVRRAWGVWTPAATAARSVVATIVALAVGVSWRTEGPMVILELVAGSVLVALVLRALGEPMRLSDV
jgi:O-antigen/teichoic acid export membrane protein